MGLITGAWSGIPNLLITIFFGLLVISIAVYLSEKFGKQYAPLVMVGMMTGLQIMVGMMTGKAVTLTMGGKEFFIVAGSLMYPVLALGDDFLNEFYGPKVAKSSVYAQFIARALTTVFLIWLMFLPEPSFKPGNYNTFIEIMGLVPRVAIASMIATYVGGIINVNIFDKIKQKTEGTFLWLRTLVSTTVGLFVNAVVFTLLAFAGTVPMGQMLEMVLISVIVRTITGFIEVPFLYFVTYLREKGIILKSDEPISIAPLKGHYSTDDIF